MSTDAADRIPPVYAETFAVRSYETDPSSRLSLVWFNRMLQEVAWQHAKRLGWGLVDRDGGHYWVLSRLRISLNRLPIWGEQFKVTTFPTGTDRILANREFTIASKEEQLASAFSSWLIVDSKTQRPLRPQKLIQGIPLTPSEYRGTTERLPAFESGHGSPAVTSPKQVLFHDIDLYRHVNNAAYLEWILDSLPMEFLLEATPVTVAIDFLQETLLDDVYRVVRPTHDDTSRFTVIRERDDVPVCRAHIQWRA